MRPRPTGMRWPRSLAGRGHPGRWSPPVRSAYNVYQRSNMARRQGIPLIGEVEQLVLLAMLRLGDGAYAVPIRALVAQETGITLSRGAVYVTLERLEEKGYVTSWFTDPIAVRGGKARRMFRLKPAGLAAMRISKDAVDRLAAGTSLGEPRRGRG